MHIWRTTVEIGEGGGVYGEHFYFAFQCLYMGPQMNTQFITHEWVRNAYASLFDLTEQWHVASHERTFTALQHTHTHISIDSYICFVNKRKKNICVYYNIHVDTMTK